MAAPIGNKNASKSRMFEQALIREIKQRDLTDGEGETLRKVAANLLDMAKTELSAAVQLRDTLDGKPAQAVTLAGDPDAPLQSKVTVEFVESKPA